MWKIYYAIYSRGGKLETFNVYPKEYKRKGYAERIGRAMFSKLVIDTHKMVLWRVATKNPFAEISLNDYLELKK